MSPRNAILLVAAVLLVFGALPASSRAYSGQNDNEGEHKILERLKQGGTQQLSV